jgi:ubiquitin-protein ligase E3 C
VEMKKHTVYAGGYHPTQPYVHEFWDVVSNDLSSDQRGKLLKFITSCSRPPLAGFGSLDPKITIYQVRDDVERLPTASTCVNLLKLPKYPSKEILHHKLLVAIESESGFELS